MPLDPDFGIVEGDDAVLQDFYKRRAKKPDLYGYDGEGNLVIRNKDGSIEKTISLPKYRPLNVEEIATLEETRRQAIGAAETAYETAMDELRTVIMEYRHGRALPSAVKDAQLEVERRDEVRIHAQLPDYGVRIIDNLASNKLFPENKYDKRILDYKVFKIVSNSLPAKSSYVKAISEAEEAAAQRAAEEAEGEELEVDTGFAEPEAEKPKSNILILFNHPDDNEYGWLSNEYPVEYNWKGVRYFTVDQAVAAEKARYYGNMETLQKIMKTRSATTMRAEARKLGILTVDPASQAAAAEVGATAAVQVQKEAQWNQMKPKVQLSVLLAKFRQHIALGRKLVETGDAQIAYAENRNTDEGIGLALTDARAGTPSKWRGKNTLGEALMQVRTQLRGGAAEVTAAEASVLGAGPQAATEEEAANEAAQRAVVGSIIARRTPTN
jgi:ribA/ribD-fused uncharacterized protein